MKEPPTGRRLSRGAGIAIAGVGITALLWMCFLVLQGGQRAAEVRSEVVDCIAGLKPLTTLSPSASEYLEGGMGWTQEERGFYSAYFAVPEPEGIAEWMTARPRDWEEWEAWSHEAALSGVGVQAIGIAKREATLGIKAYEAAVVDRAVSLPRQRRLGEAVRKALSEEIGEVVTRLRREDWRAARQSLRECGGIEARLRMDEVELEVLRQSSGRGNIPKESGK